MKDNARLTVYSIFIVLLICFNIVSGQELPNSTTNDGLAIDSIEILNNNIFDTELPEFQNWIFGLANKLHLKTRPHVIRRESLLNEGDPFSRSLADETERNLESLTYLWEADLKMVKGSNGENILRITTNDRWSLTGGISLSRNSGENTIHLRGDESNFLGYGQEFSWDYYIRDTLEDFFVFSFTERRLLGTRNRIDLYYNDEPESGLKGFVASRPYYSLDSRFSYLFSYYDLDRRINNYVDDEIVRQYFKKGDLFNFTAGFRFGERLHKTRFGIELINRRLSIEDVAIFNDDLLPVLPDDSNYTTIAILTGLDNFEYIKLRRIRSFKLNDYIGLDKGGTIKVGRAIGSGGNRLYNFISFDLFYDFYYKSNLMFIYFENQFSYLENIDFRKALNFSILYYNNRLEWITPTVKASYRSDYRLDEVEAVFLGENSGLRGLPRNYRTGENRLLLNIENRIFLGLEYMSVNVGLAQFVDIGKIWLRDDKFGSGETYWSTGLGLRFGTERVSSSRIARFDLIYSSNRENWEISFGLGQYFGLQ